MNTVVVHKLDTKDNVVVSYEARLVRRLPNGVLLDAIWTRPALDLGYTVFEPGAHFAEWFFSDRWYNIFAIHATSGALKGWYCNIGEPAAISDAEVRYRDLYLDVWVSASGETQVLDEDELAADETLDEASRTRALAAADELLRLVRDRVSPFDAI